MAAPARSAFVPCPPQQPAAQLPVPVNASSDSAYNFSFTAASLRPELGRVIAEAYRDGGTWIAARARVLESNALQSRSQLSAIRMERELRQRLMTLTELQLAHLASATLDDAADLSWLAVLKYNRFIYEFAAGALRDKLAVHDATLRLSDYESFVSGVTAAHPELAALTQSTRAKVRTVILRMLTEAGLLVKGESLGSITRPYLTVAVQRLIVDDDRRWLAGFLIPDNEIERL